MTPSKAELQALLERVEKAEGPDWEINAELARLDGLIFDDARGVWTTPDAQPNEFRILPNYTRSIDAAVNLVEKMLPEGENVFLLDISVTPKIGVSLSGAKAGARLLYYTQKRYPKSEGFPQAEDHAAGAPTAPLALISALLKALIAKAKAACAQKQEGRDER